MGCHRVPDRPRMDTGTAPARPKNANRVANELPCVRPGEPNGRSTSCRTQVESEREKGQGTISAPAFPVWAIRSSRDIDSARAQNGTGTFCAPGV
jgi:hypothetical protein